MKILIASDKFKGSLTALEACRAIEEGLKNGNHETRCVPVADGGDGMAGTLTDALGGEWREVEVSGPLGALVQAGYGIIENGKTTVIEMAEASGLALLGESVKDPWSASTYGTGQLIADAIAQGAKKVILGIGGSATNDGGSGMALALGYRFLDAEGNEVCAVPANLESVVRIEHPSSPDFPEVTVACDVVNPLLGPDGCTRIYGPQKGILPSDFEKHEARLEHLSSYFGDIGTHSAQIPGSGAAGGLGFGSLVFLNARLVPGFDLVSNILNLEEQVRWADIVITGEGKIDAQSLEGKAPAGVASLAKKHGKKVLGFCGLRGDGDLGACFDRIYEIEKGDRSVEESMRDGAELLKLTVEKVSHDWVD